MVRHKIACLPEEPLRNACVAEMSVAENMALRSFDQKPASPDGIRLRRAPMREAARKLIDAYRVKTPGPDAAIKGLSGGNVQRAVLARELSSEGDVLIVANPCFGLDFAAVAEIRARIVTPLPTPEPVAGSGDGPPVEGAAPEAPTPIPGQAQQPIAPPTPAPAQPDTDVQ